MDQVLELDDIDHLIHLLKEMYAVGGMPDVVDWVSRNLSPMNRLIIDRGFRKETVKTGRVIYDRSILKLDQFGNETNAFFLLPLRAENLQESELYLSVRLNFVSTPFALLIYTFIQ